jgi:hypothetical protein
MHCINKAVLCSGNNNVSSVSEEILNNLNRNIKVNVDPILYRPSVKMDFPAEFQILSNKYVIVTW